MITALVTSQGGRSVEEGDPMKFKPVFATAAGVALLFGSVACGSDSESPEGQGQEEQGQEEQGQEASGFVDSSANEIMGEAQTAMKEAESLRFSGNLTTDGTEIEMDVAVATSGDCAGTVTLNGGTAEVLRVDEASWMRGDEAFWTAAAGPQGAAVAKAVGEKWVKDDEGDFTRFCDLIDELVEGDPDDETYTKGDVTEIDGAEAIAINVEDDSGTSTAYVATEDPHHLLSLSREGQGEVAFSDYGEPVEAEAPAREEQVDLDQLG